MGKEIYRESSEPREETTMIKKTNGRMERVPFYDASLYVSPGETVDVAATLDAIRKAPKKLHKKTSGHTKYRNK
jgi:hypothetical protein